MGEPIQYKEVIVQKFAERTRKEKGSYQRLLQISEHIHKNTRQHESNSARGDLHRDIYVCAIIGRTSTSATAVRIQGWAPVAWHSLWLVLDDVLDLLQDLGGQLGDNLKSFDILQDCKRPVRRGSARRRYTHAAQGGMRPRPWCSCLDHGLATPGRAAQLCSQGRLQQVRQAPSFWRSEPVERGCSSRRG
jgi:hypothetical protein